MTGDRFLSRRRLLATAGTLGVLYGGGRLGLAAFDLDPARFDSHARLPGPQPLIVDWTSRYESPTARPPDASVDRGGTPDAALVVALGQLAPGDRGELVVRLRSEPAVDGDQSPVAVSLRPRVYDLAENGLTEPERSAGDTTPDTGELQEYVDVQFWADAGLGWLGVGACNGHRDESDPLLAAGTLGAIGRADRELPLAGPGSHRDCLQRGEGVCFGVEWSIPADVNNAVQGDSVRFDLGINTEACTA